jgi:hypothetical protein
MNSAHGYVYFDSVSTTVSTSSCFTMAAKTFTDTISTSCSD